MRIPRLAAVIPAAVAVAAILVGSSEAAHAAPKRCLASGICVQVTKGPGAKVNLVVTGTPGADTITFQRINATSNIGLPEIGVNGFDTNVTTNANAIITATGLGGNDTISLAGLNVVGTFRAFGTATLSGDAGDDKLTASNGGVSVLVAGSGQDLMLARNGRADIVQGSGNDTAQVDASDKVTGVAKFLP